LTLKKDKISDSFLTGLSDVKLVDIYKR